MRLADLVRHEARNRKHPLSSDFAEMAEAISGAHLFEIAPEVGAMVGVIGASPVAKLTEAMPFARTPFPCLWIELRGASSDYLDRPMGALNDRYQPVQTGLLVETDESHQRGMVSLVWSLKAPSGRLELCHSPLCTAFDWRMEPEPVPDVGLPEAIAKDPVFVAGEIEKSVSELVKLGLTREQATRDLQRAGKIINPRGSAINDFMVSQVRQGRRTPKELTEMACQDWVHEMSFLYGFLICLNSKNLLRADPPDDLTKLNKARRRMGRPELLSFSTVKLSLSQVMRRKELAAAGAGDVRAHLVRGHFKLRKTGAFWWSPFVRGDAAKGVVARRGYEVAA